MLRVLVRIQQQLDAPLSLEQLAALACFSPYHFHRIFTGMLGESLKSHIRRLRLERAASRLKLSRMPVIEVALEAGYDSHEGFSRAFKSAFRSSPSGFRHLKGACWQAWARSGVHYDKAQPLKNFKTTRTLNQNMKVTIKKIEPMRVAFLRHLGPYSQCGATWDKFLTFLGKEGLLGGDAMFIGICHDDPDITPPEKVRYDACVTVGPDFTPQGEIGVQTIPGGEYAVMTHFGPYGQLGQSYAKLLGQWLPRSGRELRSSPCFEVYLNSPENTAPEDLLTDLHAPLEPA
jgi:AraC family transcriptional regulator